jgi:hypothetical protein
MRSLIVISTAALLATGGTLYAQTTPPPQNPPKAGPTDPAPKPGEEKQPTGAEPVTPKKQANPRPESGPTDQSPPAPKN